MLHSRVSAQTRSTIPARIAGSPPAAVWCSGRNQFQHWLALPAMDCCGSTSTNWWVSANWSNLVLAAKASGSWWQPCSASSNGALVVLRRPFGR